MDSERAANDDVALAALLVIDVVVLIVAAAVVIDGPVAAGEFGDDHFMPNLFICVGGESRGESPMIHSLFARTPPNLEICTIARRILATTGFPCPRARP
jgi:hypothetical protein